MRADFRASASVFLITALVVLLVTSCAVTPPARIGGAKAPCPARTISLLSQAVPGKVPSISSVRATLDVQLTADEPGYNQRFQVGLAAERPDKLRLNIYTGFLSLASVAIDGDSIWAFLPSNSILLAGSLDEVSRQALLPAATGFLLDEVRSILFPGPFCIDGCKSEQIGRGRCRFEDETEDGKRIGVVDSRTGKLLSLAFVDRDGTERVQVNYGDYRRSGRVSFPHDISVSLPSDGVKLRLVFHRAILNHEIDEKEFRLRDLPSGRVTGFETLWN